MGVHVDETWCEDPFPMLAVYYAGFRMRSILFTATAGGNGLYIA